MPRSRSMAICQYYRTGGTELGTDFSRRFTTSFAETTKAYADSRNGLIAYRRHVAALRSPSAREPSNPGSADGAVPGPGTADTPVWDVQLLGDARLECVALTPAARSWKCRP